MARRSKIEVVIDILKVIATGRMKRTHIMQRANLSWDALEKELRTLEGRGIVKSEDQRGRVYVTLTQAGYDMLGRFQDIVQMYPEVKTRENRISPGLERLYLLDE